MSARKLSKSLFLNSRPLSLLIFLTVFLSCSSTCLMNVFSLGVASDFCLRKKTQVKREKSSTITRIYLLPPKLSITEGPHKSICKSSRASAIFVLIRVGWLFLFYFPISHVAHRWSLSNLRRGSPRT